MKKILLLMALLLGTFSSTYAEKRIKSISLNASSGTELMELSYDEEGKLAAATFYSNEELEQTWTFTYNLPYEITNLVVNYNGYQNTELYNIQDGLASVRTLEMPGDNIIVRNEFSYENQRMQTLNVYVNDRLKSSFELTWAGDNMVSGIMNGNRYYTFEYSDLTGNAVAKWLFSLMGFVENPYLHNLNSMPFLGIVGYPTNNFLSNYHYEYSDRSEDINFEYTSDYDGCITHVTMLKTSSENGRKPSTSTYEYELEWEDASSSNIVTTRIDKERSSILYNMNGQRVDSNYYGIVVINGQKFFNNKDILKTR